MGRKIAICDDVGFCGAMNIHEDDGGEKFGTGKFYDVHAKLEGPCVFDLAEVFRDSLRESGSLVARDAVKPPAEVGFPGVYVQVLESNVRQRRRTLQKVIARAIDAADYNVHLTTS